MLEQFTNCPFCNAEISFLLDPSVSIQEYVEDCEVCCRPLEVSVQFDNADLVGFDVRAVEQ